MSAKGYSRKSETESREGRTLPMPYSTFFIDRYLGKGVGVALRADLLLRVPETSYWIVPVRENRHNLLRERSLAMFARLCPALIVGSLLAIPSVTFCQTDSTSKRTAECLPKELVLRNNDMPNGGCSSPIIIEPTNDKVRATVLIC
jgi:hypothetical protein